MANLPQVGLDAVIANLPAFVAGARAITNAYDAIEKKTGSVEKATSNLGSSLSKTLLDFGKFAAQAGIATVATSIGAATISGFKYNNMLQQASARIQAFTKDADLTAATIKIIREEADKTPFSFAEMVTAAGSLQPVMKASGESLESLIKTAEILAASNPLQGLEGASFALREAVSGDFTSIIERFNLSRVTINRLKEEGVPSLEIVRQAMAEMGFDAELVSEMALTMEGRWSTFSDTMTRLAGIVTQPMFDQMSESLGRLNDALAKNETSVQRWAEVMSANIVQPLADGLDAWTFVLLDAIPAIQKHENTLATDAAQAILTAKSYDEAAIATQNAQLNIDAFQKALISNTSSHEEYQSAIDKVAESNIFLAQQLDLTTEGYDNAKQAIIEAVVTSGEWVSSIETMNMTAGSAVAAQQILADAIRETTAAQQAAAAGFSEMTSRQQAGMAAMALARGRTPELLGAFQLKEEERKRKEQEDAAKELIKLQEKSAKQMAKSFEQAANSIVSTIESVIKPTLDEVWTPPADSVVRFDEAARRLATVSSSGFGSEWLTQLASQFAGQDFFQPVIAAMEAGDPEALKNAANSILMNNVTQLWDVEVIKQKVREQLQQQNLRQQIIDQVKEELNMEGTTIGAEAITPITDGLSTIVQNAPPAGAALTTLGTDIGTSQPTLDTYGQGLSDTSTLLGTISEETIPAAITKIGELTTAIKTKLVAILNTSLLPALRNVSDFITKNLVISFTDIDSIINEKIIPNLGKFSENIIPDFIAGMEDLNSTIKDVSGSFNDLSNKVKNFKLPAVLTPGSPTPFELALIGISQAAQSAAGSMQDFSNALNGANFDKLLGIDRSLVDPLNIAGAAFDDLEKHLDKTIGRGKGAFALKHIKTAIKANLGDILKSLDPKKTLDEVIQHAVPNWEKVGIKLQDVAGVFWNSFKGNAKEAIDTLRQMFIEGAQTAIGIGQKLTGVISGAVEMLNSRIERLQGIVAAGGGEFEGHVLSAVDAQNLLNLALQEQAAIQDDILKTKEQESKLAFLQQQLDLFDMINQAGLDVGEVLGGLTLGLNASIPDLIAATNAVIEAMINQVNTDLGDIVNVGAALGSALTTGVTGSLGIASPSKVMQALADNTMSSFMNRMLSWGPAIAGAAGSAIAGPTMVAAPALASVGAGNQTTINANFGGNSISSGMDEAQFDSMVLRSIQRLMR